MMRLALAWEWALQVTTSAALSLLKLLVALHCWLADIMGRHCRGDVAAGTADNTRVIRRPWQALGTSDKICRPTNLGPNGPLHLDAVQQFSTQRWNFGSSLRLLWPCCHGECPHLVLASARHTLPGPPPLLAHPSCPPGTCTALCLG